MTPKYRADIDGLRAIAVLSVLFFHSGIGSFSGGYVGVDIFFVISGYLITSIIVREIERGDFSIVKFYERRFRRILPALTVVVVLSLIFGVLLFDSKQLYDLGQSAVATSIFSSNILFYLESGYFDGPSELKPLLHTWSLAVEEQFYIFFPILLILIAKMGDRKYSKWLIPLALLSFALCVMGMDFDASGTFYLIPTRAWELLVGSLLAINVFPETRHRYARDFLSITGLLMMAFSIFTYTPDTKFPGIAAAIPTIGAALVIYSGITGKSFIGRFLSLKPIVFIGLISYSLYLWHWPVIVYTKYYSIVELNNFEITIMLCLIFVLSVLSWRYIESPFRKKTIFARRNSLFSFASVVSVIVIGIGLLMTVTEGLPNRYANVPNMQMVSDDPEWQYWGDCQKVREKLDGKKDLCNIGIDSKDASFILWGDSHARALASSVHHGAKKHGLTGKVATKDACPPLLYIEKLNRLSCHKFNLAVLKYISDKQGIEVVLLAARWTYFANGTRYKNESGATAKLVDIQSNSNAEIPNITLFDIGLKRTIENLQRLGKKVVLVSPVPEIGYDVPSAYFVSKITEREVDSIISPSSDEYYQRNQSVLSIFASMEKEHNIEIVNPSKYLCDKEYCKVIADDISLYRDDDHLSTFGSKYVSRSFDTVFAKMVNTAQPK